MIQNLCRAARSLNRPGLGCGATARRARLRGNCQMQTGIRAGARHGRRHPTRHLGPPHNLAAGGGHQVWDAEGNRSGTASSSPAGRVSARSGSVAFAARPVRAGGEVMATLGRLLSPDQACQGRRVSPPPAEPTGCRSHAHRPGQAPNQSMGPRIEGCLLRLPAKAQH